MARYVVGIDLGTTNSALAYAEAPPEGDAPRPRVEGFGVPQVVNPGEVAARAVLPSFLYLPGEKDFAPGSIDLPWLKKSPDRVAGTLARDQGAKVPGRMVGSAKSWLCHPGVDRRAAILPWAAAEGVQKVSPVDASAVYLEHLRGAWDHGIAGKAAADRLENQEIILTVPASFDPAARELTVEAARKAGLPHVTLLEEPLAAFYAWLESRGDSWRQEVKVGDAILVCDVGGGTTDFTLITVGDEGGDLTLTRSAVGEHILLGGDNMDLALAYAVASGLPGGMEALDAAQRVALTYACRAAKEALFSDPKAASAPVVILGRGSKVIGGSIKAELKRETLASVLLDGFFPKCAPTDLPERGRRVGLSEIGLPYAADPAITKHLARFLSRQAAPMDAAGSLVKPAAVLFNGGVFEAGPLKARVLEVLSDWSGKPVPALPVEGLDQAVARGAAYYGLVRQGKGLRVRGGVPRSYYIGIETAAPAVPGIAPPIKALCVVPQGMEEGTEADVPGPPLNLIVGEPAQFRFLSSNTRKQDAPGTILNRWQADELQELEPVETTLPIDDGPAEGAETLPVRLHAHVTEVGTLDLWCQGTDGPRRWKLEYNVREPS